MYTVKYKYHENASYNEYELDTLEEAQEEALYQLELGAIVQIEELE